MRRKASRIFRDLGPPPAPLELRRRTLAAAAQASNRPVAVTSPARRSLADRCWESRPLWVAWGLTAVLLLAVNAHLDSFVGAPRSKPSEDEIATLETAPADPGSTERRTLLSSREVVLRDWLEGPPAPTGRSDRGTGS